MNTPEKKRRKAIIRIFGLLWLIGFIAGGIAKYVHDVSGGPEWLNTLIDIFGGLGGCSLGLFAIVSAFTYYWDTESCDDKLKVIYALIIGIPSFIFGVFFLGRGLFLLYNGFR